MATILQFDFPYPGPWGEEGARALKDLAESIAAEPGLVWKVWTENEAEGIAGGIYCFADEPSALAYRDMHSARLASFGVTDIRAKVFDVNEGLSAITNFKIA
ncbi:monooxygenase [Microbaculum marinum]|uniref:Monooxygenase n=1 Tax=Microbaculum marinum TaxID=1764581 RepID=A0AAW9RRJ6_9HYPH